jgi:hypothetical protein
MYHISVGIKKGVLNEKRCTMTMNTHRFKLIKILIECVYEKYGFLQEQIISYLKQQVMKLLTF